MKWGVRKKKDIINSRDRTIKKGTEIQNISKGQYDSNNNNRMYGSYTSYDKAMYIDMMGNTMYLGQGYKNTFHVKKDIKIPSDQKLVSEFIKLCKEDPQQVIQDMTDAYNVTHIFSKKQKDFANKVNNIDNLSVKKGEKLTKQYASLIVANETVKSRTKFFDSLIKQGYDGMSDVNDRDPNAGTQDPLIIFNPKKSLDKVSSVKLTEKELNKYFSMTSYDEEFHKKASDFSEVQR